MNVGNMSNSVYKVFEEIEFKAKLLAQYWQNFHIEISQHLPESYQPEIQELSNNLETALTQLVYELQNPTLTLATTGTTSSGKSTLVNLLCGAEIVPVAVSEMSAGAVTIEYSQEKSLIIHETPGALWECGEWRGISDDIIYQRLYQAMRSYINNREKPNLACPQCTITYPFRLLKESQLQLPPGTRVRILDLPGLAYVGDQGNANVIKQCREALCIVTYNSAETDSQKVKSLLQEVVQQVKDLGGSPARMLFALNRIDVFRADRSWPESENRFVEKAIRDIKNELTEQLKEYTEDIENLKVVKLSTWPALLSLQIQNQDDIYSTEACEKADRCFYQLIEDILEDLPRNKQKWNRHEKNRVAQALWDKSYAEEFHQNLTEHINQHFQQLVIPQMIERCKPKLDTLERLSIKVQQILAKESEDNIIKCINNTTLELQEYVFMNQEPETITIFEKVKLQARRFARDWDNFSTEILQQLPATYQPQIKPLSDKLAPALSKLINELDNPILTLATTGTTSSGKSTLVNLLCGAEIVPVAVSEMSAGAVTIEYSQEKSLIIHDTPGALWERGEWRGISDEEIYRRLYEVMINYINNREQQPNLACPQSTISYPFRLFTESKLQLPQGTRVRILDLPGLAYVGDEGNTNVIRQCKEALSIVTYNCAEVDPQKVKTLLKEVVEQVKQLGGSPVRMLFVLNKIDVFRADTFWPESENRFVENTIKSIKAELTESLPEYTEKIEDLKVVQLSTWPALLSLQIQNQDDIYNTEACTKARNQFYGLIENILEELPGGIRKWTRHDKNRVAKALWEKSYGGEFHQNLTNHINEHFPQLIIPQMIDRFNNAAANEIRQWAVQTTEAILNSNKKKYEVECENIVRIRSELKHFLDDSNKRLREPFGHFQEALADKSAIEGSEGRFSYLEDTLKKLQDKNDPLNPYSKLGKKLYSLYGWRRELGKGINVVLEGVIKSLISGKVNLEDITFKKAKPRETKSLENCLGRLVKSGYMGSVAKNGEKREARTDTEKNQLKVINEELNELAINLSRVMEDVLKEICKQEFNRMYEAVVELFKCHLSFLEENAVQIAGEMAIQFPKSELIKVERQTEINFQFQAGFAVIPGTWMEKKETLNTGYGENQTKIGVGNAVERNTQGKSGWDWLSGAVTGIVYDYVIKGVIENKKYIDYTPRPTDNAMIPSVEKLFEGWILQGEGELVKISIQISEWLLKQVNDLNKNVDTMQKDIIDRYQARLDQANREIQLTYDDEIKIWQPMQQKSQELKQELFILNTLLKEES
jgi:GTPase Era involved in 16S rRNA processing